MPELTGRFFFRPSQKLAPNNYTSSASTAGLTVENDYQSEGAIEVDEQCHCYCHGPEKSEMVGYDNQNCSYKWFHLICFGLETPPTSKYWNRPDCRKLPTV